MAALGTTCLPNMPGHLEPALRMSAFTPPLPGHLLHPAFPQIGVHRNHPETQLKTRVCSFGVTPEVSNTLPGDDDVARLGTTGGGPDPSHGRLLCLAQVSAQM